MNRIQYFNLTQVASINMLYFHRECNVDSVCTILNGNHLDSGNKYHGRNRGSKGLLIYLGSVVHAKGEAGPDLPNTFRQCCSLLSST